MPVFDFLRAQSRQNIYILGAVAMLMIGVVDYLTGSEVSFSIFYLIPIATVTWFTGRRAGIIAAIVSAAIWLIADLSAGQVYSAPAIPFWNTAVRLGFFMSVLIALTSLNTVSTRQDELMQFLVHDLRSPVANAHTSLQYLLDISGDRLDAMEQDLVKMSMASDTRAMTLINSLLDLGKLESGKMQVKAQATSVAPLLDTAAQQVYALATRSEVKVVTEVDTDAEIARADSDLTTRVLVNLLSNAIKFSPIGSTVRLCAEPDNGSVRFSVTDQGMGVPVEWAAKVFDKYAQIEAKKAGIRVGSGLGLTFCRLAVEAQGGRITLESQPDVGTTVRFTLPRG